MYNIIAKTIKINGYSVAMVKSKKDVNLHINSPAMNPPKFFGRIRAAGQDFDAQPSLKPKHMLAWPGAAHHTAAHILHRRGPLSELVDRAAAARPSLRTRA